MAVEDFLGGAPCIPMPTWPSHAGTPTTRRRTYRPIPERARAWYSAAEPGHDYFDVRGCGKEAIDIATDPTLALLKLCANVRGCAATNDRRGGEAHDAREKASVEKSVAAGRPSVSMRGPFTH